MGGPFCCHTYHSWVFVVAANRFYGFKRFLNPKKMLPCLKAAFF
jgi:hypothetical protein